MTLSGTKTFGLAEIEALAGALADSVGGLTHSNIDTLLAQCHLIHDRQGTEAKQDRLIRAFVVSQNFLKSNAAILQFVRLAARPSRFINRQPEYDEFRHALNVALAFGGVAVGNDGELVSVKTATTLNDAQRRASELRADLNARNVHPDVMQFCRAELLTENYFHAVLEATKSVSAKIRQIAYLEDDGSALVDLAFGGSESSWVINPYQTLNHKKEQAGFCNLLKGIFGMFRNPIAHEAKIHSVIEKEDAADLLSILSLAHRRIDKAHMRPRA